MLTMATSSFPIKLKQRSALFYGSNGKGHFSLHSGSFKQLPWYYTVGNWSYNEQISIYFPFVDVTDQLPLDTTLTRLWCDVRHQQSREQTYLIFE
jgi:hypothetical protein